MNILEALMIGTIAGIVANLFTTVFGREKRFEAIITNIRDIKLKIVAKEEEKKTDKKKHDKFRFTQLIKHIANTRNINSLFFLFSFQPFIAFVLGFFFYVFVFFYKLRDSSLQIKLFTDTVLTVEPITGFTDLSSCFIYGHLGVFSVAALLLTLYFIKIKILSLPDQFINASIEDRQQYQQHSYILPYAQFKAACFDWLTNVNPQQNAKNLVQIKSYLGFLDVKYRNITMEVKIINVGLVCCMVGLVFSVWNTSVR